MADSEITKLAEGEMWRYRAIAQEPQISRPDDWFSPDEYVAVRIWQIWTAARIIELGGGSPRALMICVDQGKYICRPVDKCDSHCDQRFWADVSQGDVLGKKDLLRILASPEVTGRGPIGCRQAKELLDIIEQLEARQGNC
jgi:hypothetical protein